MEIKTLFTTNTALNADCIDFCPIEPFTHLFAVGTYELVENSEKCDASDESTSERSAERVGSVQLYSIKQDEVKILHQFKMPGVLDLRWCPHKIHNRIILGVAEAKGCVFLYSLENGNHLRQLALDFATCDLALYIDWSTVLTCDDPKLAVSDSKGNVCVFAVQENEGRKKPIKISVANYFKAHDFEVWVTSFNYWNSDIVYSGGDDSKFTAYDIGSRTRIFTSKAHSAGVTAIQHSLWKENLLFSGCYDGNLLSWDFRNMKQPLSSTNLGGGVWRLRNEPFHKPLMLASTMHNGFHILKVDENDKPKIINTYSKHGSLAYGADWSRSSKGPKYLIGSVSFYDKMLSLWEVKV